MSNLRHISTLENRRSKLNTQFPQDSQGSYVGFPGRFPKVFQKPFIRFLHHSQEIQTTEEQRSEPSAGSTAKAAGAPNKISTVSTAQAASAPSSSSSVVTTSTPASVVPDGLRPRTQAPVTLPPTGPPDWVWIIGNGIRYHRASCGMVRVQSRRTRHLLRSDAIRSGYTACQQCGG